MVKEARLNRGGESDRLKKLETLSGFKVKPVYGPEDIRDLDYKKQLGEPGCFPYTRGRYPEGYRKQLWLRHQDIGFGGAEETNKAWKFVIQEGEVHGLEIPPDGTTLLGVDPDHPLATAEVGCAGPAQYSVIQLEKITEGISLEGGAFHVLGGGPICSPVWAMFVVAAKRRGFDITKLRGAMINDYLHQGLLDLWNIHPFDVCWRFQVDSLEYCARETPSYTGAFMQGYALGEGGANCYQEVALCLLERMAYVDAVMEKGVPFERIATRVAIEFNAGIDFFELVCKFRAVRRMWAKIAVDKYKQAPDARGVSFPISCSGAGNATRAQQPILNACRTTMEVLACVMGGAQAIQGRPYDEPISLPTKQSFLLTSQIQHMIAHESGVPLVADPLGGSYYVEWLTNKIGEEANNFINEVEAHGGIVKCAQQNREGWLQTMLTRAVIRREAEILEGKRIITGVTALRIPKKYEIKVPIFKLPDQTALQKRVKEECAQLKQTRDNHRLAQDLKKLYEATKQNKNIFYAMMDAIDAGATHGEIVGIVREAYGHPYDVFNMIKRPDFITL